MIANFLMGIAGSLAARVLVSLGISIFSYAALITFASQVTNLAYSNYNNLSGDVLAILNIAGAGQCFSILSAAVITRASLSAIKTFRPT